MGKIFYIMGKSSSGKDTIFQELLAREELQLHKIVLYTTRPIRTKELDGRDYHFVGEEALAEFEKQGKVIELRCYQTIQGPWKYFTVDDDKMDLENKNYLVIGTLVSYEKMKAYYGPEKLVTIYIQVSDDIRLERALQRERKQLSPDYEEMCRRFLADSDDFTEEKLKAAGIERRFWNDGECEACIEEIAEFIAAKEN